MTTYSVEPQYDYPVEYGSVIGLKRRKVGYAVLAETGNSWTKVYWSKWWILCFLKANRLTKAEAK